MRKPPKNRWFFLSGDASPESYGGMWARLTDHDVWLVRVENAQDVLGDADAENVDGPFCVTIGGFDLHNLEHDPDVSRAVDYIDAHEALATAHPSWRPLIIAEALFQYGRGVTDDCWTDTGGVAAAFAPQKQVESFSRRAFRQAERDWKQATQPNR